MTRPAPTANADLSSIDELDDDDRLIGRILARREVLALIGASGTAAFLAACTPGGSSSPSTSSARAAGASASAIASAAATAS